MGASTSSLAPSFHPSSTTTLKEKSDAGAPSQRTMISPSTTSFQNQHHVRFDSKNPNVMHDGTSKHKPIVIPRHPSVDWKSCPSVKPRKTHPDMTSFSDERPFMRSKTHPHVPSAIPGSEIYPNVAIPRRSMSSALNGSGKPLKGSNSSPRRTLGPISDSTHHSQKSSSAAVTRDFSTDRVASVSMSGVPNVNIASRKRSQNQPGVTRPVTKSPSRSTVGSSSKMSSSSGALSSREGRLASSQKIPSSSRSHRCPPHSTGFVKRKGTGEDMKQVVLKPIHEVEARDCVGVQGGKTSHHQIPSRPPGLASIRNSATSSLGAQAPVVSSKPALPSSQHSRVDSQTKRLNRFLTRSSEVVLSVVNHRIEDVSQEESDKPELETSGEPGKEESDPEVLQNVKTDANKPLAFLSLPLYLSDPERLSGLLQFLSFSDWCSLFNASKEIRLMISHNELLREEVLERFLGEVGYSRWVWRETEPVMISLTDMFYYVKGASIPPSEYVRVAERFLASSTGSEDDSALADKVLGLANATRAYNRLVLRLRAQSEMVDHCDTLSATGSSYSTPSSRRSSCVPGSASASFISSSPEAIQHSVSPAPSRLSSTGSPLYRPNRAALLRVFVPSPNGEWLSDFSVLECEAELKRAGLGGQMRLGDVVWDVAVGDERGNMGKLIWDGCYLLDLDYTYSSTGDIPRHISSLALPPSYFHGIVRGGPLNLDPIVRVDVSPWGEEIARNLQLMQDRMMTETPRGLQNVVRWVHRSTFTIRPPSSRSSISSSGKRNGRPAQTGIPIRDSNGQVVHSSWYGSVIIETDGTSEALDDLKERCGPGVFPQRALAAVRHGKSKGQHERMVWRILREKSRPGEIWIKVITPRERLM